MFVHLLLLFKGEGIIFFCIFFCIQSIRWKDRTFVTVIATFLLFTHLTLLSSLF